MHFPFNMYRFSILTFLKAFFPSSLFYISASKHFYNLICLIFFITIYNPKPPLSVEPTLGFIVVSLVVAL